MNVKSRRKSAAQTWHLVVPFLLPTQRTWWHTLQAWLRQSWQRLRLPRFIVQPPLQPARHKPFPQRPHQQRRQTVFAVLDAAPAGLTRRELIAHVRTLTGLGCSEKLITEWRQARQNTSEMERPCDAGKKHRRLLGLLWCVSITACATTMPVAPPASEITISPAPSEVPTLSSAPSPTNPRLLRMKLTLQAPHELQVKAGQQIAAGALLSDRASARQRLLIQQRALLTAVHHLHTQRQLTDESLRQFQSLGLGLPPTTFAAEQAAIRRAETEAIAVNRAVEIQREKVLSLAGVVASCESLVSSGESPESNQLLSARNPKPETRNLIAAHEEAKLTQAKDQHLLALSDIELQKAKLTTAREIRAWEEQKHRVEITRQILAIRSQQQQAETESARLTAQLAELDLQLAQLAAVRAPFAGTIKRIEGEDTNDEKLIVVVYLAVGNR